jgi:hypothetical protein
VALHQSREALEYARSALALATSLTFAGPTEHAEPGYEQSIALQADMYKAHSALSQLHRQTTEHNHLRRLQALQREVSNPVGQLHIGHALAKEQEDLEQYPAAL